MPEKEFQNNFYGNLKINKNIAFGLHKEKRLKIIDYIEKNLNINFKRDLKIAEFGCGTGYFSAYLLRKYKNLNIDLYDISLSVESVIEKVMSISKINSNRYNFFAVDINKELINKKYDIIFMCGALHHSYNLKEYFESIKKSLNPNGILVAQEPAFKEEINFKDLKKHYTDRLSLKFDKDFPLYPRYDTFFKVSEYLVASRYAGLDLVKLKKWKKFMNHPEHYVGEKYEKNIIKKLIFYYFKFFLNIYKNYKVNMKKYLDNNLHDYLMIFKNNSKLDGNQWLPHLDLLGLK